MIVVINVFFGVNRLGYFNIVGIFFLVLMVVFIVIINCFVVFLVWKKKVFCLLVNICLMSFVCLDVLLGFCVILLVIVCMVLERDYMYVGWWCFSMDFMSRMLFILVILYLLVIVVERYVVIVCYVRLDNFFSLKKYVVIVLVVWFILLCVLFI